MTSKKRLSLKETSRNITKLIASIKKSMSDRNPRGATSSPNALVQNLVIYYNDSIDSDNWLAAKALHQKYGNRPDTRIVWILEPRQVAFGAFEDPADQRRCRELLKQHFADDGGASMMLQGSLTEELLTQKGRHLPDEDKKILRIAIKVEYGGEEDAKLHRRLTAWDLATCIKQWANDDLTVFMDFGALKDLHNPVNLKVHHPEELISRERRELEEHKEIRKIGVMDERIEKLRGWYDACIKTLENVNEEQGDGKHITVEELDFKRLCDDIEAAPKVQLFGGASLSLLNRLLLDKRRAAKIDVHLQIGSLDLAMNLFGNQFNAALNVNAYIYVMKNFKFFKSFRVVPSHTAQAVRYPVRSFINNGSNKIADGCLEKQILGFNFREDPQDIINETVKLEHHENETFTSPDLTAWLCALSNGFKKQEAQGGQTKTYTPSTKYVKNTKKGAAWLLELTEDDKYIPMLDLEEITLSEHDIDELWKSLKKKDEAGAGKGNSGLGTCP